jgi:hypothetical protein
MKLGGDRAPGRAATWCVGGRIPDRLLLVQSHSERTVMTKKSAILGMFTAVVVILAWGSAAQAQATRTWVSGVGDDVNPCSRTAPCKTFAGAISKTAAGGEISTLDPGGFGAVTITKSITINGDGTLSSILVAGSNGVIVNAGVNDVVVLRNLSINGGGTGLNGIRYLAGRALRVENCSIQGFNNHGIDVVHTSTTTPGELTVVNTSFTRIGVVAVRVDNAVGAVAPSASLENVRINRATIGFDVRRSNVGTISNSIITNVTNQALVAENSAVLNAVNCVLSNNGIGAAAFNSTSTLRLSGCQIFNNTTGVSIVGGATGDSFGTNSILGNGVNVSGLLVVTPTE